MGNCRLNDCVYLVILNLRMAGCTQKENPQHCNYATHHIPLTNDERNHAEQCVADYKSGVTEALVPVMG